MYKVRKGTHNGISEKQHRGEERRRQEKKREKMHQSGLEP